MNQVITYLSTLGIAIVLAATTTAAESSSWGLLEDPLVTGDVEPPCLTCLPNSIPCATSAAAFEPKLQFTADLLILDRSGVDGGPLLRDATTFQPLLSNDDLMGPAQPGVRLGLILFDEDGWDVEFGYLTLDRFGSTQTRQSDNGITFPFFGGIPAEPRNSYGVVYQSDFSSGEINLRRRYGPQLTLLGGLRFLDLNERFRIVNGNRGFYSSTDNDLYGFQLGGDIQWFQIRRSVFFSTLKAGVFYNNADVGARAQGANGLIEFIDDEDEAAFVGDVAVGLLIPMGPQADLRIGYQGLFLDGVGLAPDQSDNFSLFTSSGNLDKSSVNYQGGFIGIDLIW